MAHRHIASLAGAIMVCFLVLSNLEPQYFLLHFYQAIFYLILILMLFYMEDRWVYALGILAPASWLVLTIGTGLLGGATQHVAGLFRTGIPTYKVGLMAALIAGLSVALIAVCLHRWRREFSGTKPVLATFAPSAAVVVVYYAVLITWFWQMVPATVAQNP